MWKLYVISLYPSFLNRSGAISLCDFEKKGKRIQLSWYYNSLLEYFYVLHITLYIFSADKPLPSWKQMGGKWKCGRLVEKLIAQQRLKKFSASGCY